MRYVLEKRLDLLNKYSSPYSAAFMDRLYPELSYLCNYSFKRSGGGRELVYAEWNNDTISNMKDEDFDSIIRDVKTTALIMEKSANISILDFLNGLGNGNLNEIK